MRGWDKLRRDVISVTSRHGGRHGLVLRPPRMGVKARGFAYGQSRESTILNVYAMVWRVPV